MDKLLEKYLPGFKAEEKSINEANRAIRLERRHFEWLINLLASTLETIKASDISKKAAIEVFANGLEGTNSNFNRERFIRTAYNKILKDEPNQVSDKNDDVKDAIKDVRDMKKQVSQMGLGEEVLDEKKKKKQPMKKCPECGADMPAFFTKCPKCDASVEGEKKEEKECKK